MTQLGKVFPVIILVFSVSGGKGPKKVSGETHVRLSETEDVSTDVIHSLSAVFSVPGGRCHDGDGFWCTIEKSNKEGQARFDAVQEGAKKESFLDWMLGTNCHTKALTALNKQCQDLDPVEKVSPSVCLYWYRSICIILFIAASSLLQSRLALMMMECQLIVQGQGIGAQSQRTRCLASESLKDCVSRLEDREHAFYVEFLTHIDAICLFIQNKNFEKYAEYMLNMLVIGTEKAVKNMEKMKKDLQRMMQDDFVSLKKMSNASLSMLHDQFHIQQEIIKSILRQQQEVESYQKTSLEIIAMHVASFQDISESHERLETLFQDAHGFVAHLLETLQIQAREIVIEQQNIHTKLVHGSQILVTTLDKVEKYHIKTNAAISAIFGKSSTLEDALFYVGCLLILACMHALGFPRSMKLYILMWIATSVVVERLMLSPGAALFRETSLGSFSEENVTSWYSNSIWKMVLPSWLTIASSYEGAKGYSRRLIGVLIGILWMSRTLATRKKNQGQHDDGQHNLGTTAQTREHWSSWLPQIATVVNARRRTFLRGAYSEDIHHYRNVGCCGDLMHVSQLEVTSPKCRLKVPIRNHVTVSKKFIEERLVSQRSPGYNERPKSDEMWNANMSAVDTLAGRKQTPGAKQMGIGMLTRGRKKALESHS